MSLGLLRVLLSNRRSERVWAVIGLFIPEAFSIKVICWNGSKIVMVRCTRSEVRQVWLKSENQRLCPSGRGWYHPDASRVTVKQKPACRQLSTGCLKLTARWSLLFFYHHNTTHVKRLRATWVDITLREPSRPNRSREAAILRSQCYAPGGNCEGNTKVPQRFCVKRAERCLSDRRVRTRITSTDQ